MLVVRVDEDGPTAGLSDTSALARRLGLSRWAVSRALNGQPGVSGETRARVRAAAAQAGFEPNAHARSLRGAGPRLVGLTLPAFRDAGGAVVAGELGAGLLVRGLQPDWTLGAGEPAGEARAWTHHAARRAVAVLVLGARSAPPGGGAAASPAWLDLRRRGVPVIFVEPAWGEEPDDLTVVRSDHRAAASLVAGHLHAAGHRRVGLRGFGEREQPRALALQAACEARGLSCGAVADGAGAAGDPTPRGGARRTRQSSLSVQPARLAVPPRESPSPGPGTARRGQLAATPTALVAADDLTALRVLCEHRAAGRTVPQDGSVVGYGDEPAGALAAPALTTVDPQRSQLVARTLELLDELLRDPGGTRAGCLWIAPLLRCRGSVGTVVPAGE